MATNEKKSFLESFKGLLFMSDTRNTRPLAGAMLVAHEDIPNDKPSGESTDSNQSTKQNVNNAKLSIMKRMFGI